MSTMHLFFTNPVAIWNKISRLQGACVVQSGGREPTSTHPDSSSGQGRVTYILINTFMYVITIML